MSGGGDTSGGGAASFRRYDPFSSLKKFRLSGSIELVYQDYSTESSSHGFSSKSGWATFEQIYRLGLQGYIYHPRLALFSAYISYANQNTSADQVSGDFNSRNISYDFSSTFFPSRPLSLDAYATRNTTSFDGLNLSTNDVTLDHYGARLLFTMKGYPNMRLQYNHWDIVIDRIQGRRILPEDIFDETPSSIVRTRVKDKTSIDRYSFDMNGELKSMRTRYYLSADYSELSNPQKKFTTEYLRLNTHTVLKRQTQLSTYFQYTDLDTSKLFNFSTHLILPPIFNVYHSYGYDFLKSEGSENIETQTLSGSWRYRYSKAIHARADLRYSLSKRDGNEENSYEANAGIYYGKPLGGLDFLSNYFFTSGREERNGAFTFMTHKFSAGLNTRKYQFARIYTNYNFTFRTLDFNPGGTIQIGDNKSEDMEHILLLGASGMGPKRISWTLELEARFLNSTGNQGAFRTVFFGETQVAQDLRHYTARGDLAFPFPLLKRAKTRLSAVYTTGTTNSIPARRYYYEGRFNYSVLRNLNLTAWFREEWKNKGWWEGTLLNVSDRHNWRERDYEITCDYYWRRILLSLEYTVTETDEDISQSKVSRLFIRARRRF